MLQLNLSVQPAIQTNDYRSKCRQRLRVDVPVSQVEPVYPSIQLQTNPFTWSSQVPPFTHGLLSHSSMSTRTWFSPCHGLTDIDALLIRVVLLMLME